MFQTVLSSKNYIVLGIDAARCPLQIISGNAFVDDTVTLDTSNVRDTGNESAVLPKWGGIREIGVVRASST